MEYEPYEICPHDKSHQILRSRMAVHLTKCSKNHRKTKKEQCPYDPRHLINPEDYQSHVKTCPAQESVLHHRLRDGDNKTKTINIPPVSNASTAETVMDLPVVNWDDDQEVASYNPLRNIEQKEVLRPLLIASKSVKKKFKENERRRMQQLLNENERKENQRREEEKVAAETGVRKLQNKSKVVKKPNVEETAGITGVIKQIEEVQIDDKSVAQPEASGKLQTNQSANAEACAYQGAIPKEAKNTTSIEDSSTSQQAKESPNSPKKVPFSYATALNRNVVSDEKNNITLSSSSTYVDNATVDKSCVELNHDFDNALEDGNEEDLEMNNIPEIINEMEIEEKKRTQRSTQQNSAKQKRTNLKKEEKKGKMKNCK